MVLGKAFYVTQIQITQAKAPVSLAVGDTNQQLQDLLAKSVSNVDPIEREKDAFMK